MFSSLEETLPFVTNLDGLYFFQLFKHSEGVHFYNPCFNSFCYKEDDKIARNETKGVILTQALHGSGPGSCAVVL